MSPIKNPKENIAIIGLGKAGTAIGYLLRQAGYPIVAVSSRSHLSLQSRAHYTGGRQFTAEANADAAALATCILITTPDDSIATVCREIAAHGGFKKGDKVIHLSGAGSLDLLEPARKIGAMVACIHPIQSFADVEGTIRNIPATTFGITADASLREWSVGLVRELGGIPIDVPESVKPLFHAAACMASNYLTTLIHIVEETYQSIGMSRDDAIRTYRPLVMGSLNNIESRGSVQALTGPISRGDVGTIERHIRTFREKLPGYLPAYCALGLLTVELAITKGNLSVEKAEIMKRLFEGG